MVVGNIKKDDAENRAPGENGASANGHREAPTFAPVPSVATTAGFPSIDDYFALDRYPPVPDPYLERGYADLDDLTVQASQFTSREFLDLETEKLWTRVWQMACRENEIPNVGDFHEYEIAGRSIVIVRCEPDTIKAFFNTCQHRGTAVVSGCGNATEFSCPFHGWTYGLDGSLKYLPGAWDFAHVNMAESGLRECLVGTWDGWVFINMDPEAGPLSEFIGDVLARHFDHPWLTNRRMYKMWHLGVVSACNWKVMMAAFQEVYHLRRTHPQIAAMGGDMESRADFWGLHGRLLMSHAAPPVGLEDVFTEQDIADTILGTAGIPAGTYTVPEGVPARHVVADAFKERAGEVGIDLSGASDAQILTSLQYHVFPNFMVMANRPAHPAFRFRPYGSDPNQCLFEIMFLVEMPMGLDPPRDAPIQMLQPGESLVDYEGQIGFFGVTVDQDMSNGPKIQRGLRGLDKLVFGKTLEPLVVNFHRNLERWLGITSEDVFKHS